MTVPKTVENYVSDSVDPESQRKYVNGITPSSSGGEIQSPAHSISSQSESASVNDGSSSEGDSESFEGLLKICGEAGPWQFKIFLMASFCGFCTALHNLIYAFVGAQPDYHCHIPEVPGFSYADVKNVTIPRDKDNEFETCRQYNYNVTDDVLNVNRNHSIHCESFDYDNSTFKNTIVTEYGLVCEDYFYASTVQAMASYLFTFSVLKGWKTLHGLFIPLYMFGILCGSPIFGALSDQFGRKKTILVATVIFTIAGPLVALAPNFYILLIARFILAFSSPGIYGTSFVLVIELLGSDWRGLAGNLFCLPFAVGYMVLPGVAYFIREWRYLQLALSAPSVILLVTWWFLPESPRWLLRKGRIEEAETILRQAAAVNGRKKSLPINFGSLVAKIADFEKEESVEVTWKKRILNVLDGYASLVRSPKLRLRTLVIYFCWASISMIYYGIALNSPNLAADRYLYTFFGGVLEVPSYFMVPPLIKYFGRRPVFCGFLLICSASLLASLLFAEGSVMIVALALFGKLLIGGAYSLVYLYATELMPTLLRTYGLGTASMVGRVGSIMAPYVVDLLGKENNTYPSIVFGSVSLLAGLLSIVLPETRNRRLPETVDDIEFDKISLQS